MFDTAERGRRDHPPSERRKKATWSVDKLYPSSAKPTYMRNDECNQIQRQRHQRPLTRILRGDAGVKHIPVDSRHGA
jgi:hypothetical protein